MLASSDVHVTAAVTAVTAATVLIVLIVLIDRVVGAPFSRVSVFTFRCAVVHRHRCRSSCKRMHAAPSSSHLEGSVPLRGALQQNITFCFHVLFYIYFCFKCKVKQNDKQNETKKEKRWPI